MSKQSDGQENIGTLEIGHEVINDLTTIVDAGDDIAKLAEILRPTASECREFLKIIDSLGLSNEADEFLHALNIWVSDSEREASKAKGSKGKPVFRVGIIGHAGHGKTTVTAAVLQFAEKNEGFRKLSGSASERSEDSVASISFETPNRIYIHTDYPGQIDYIREIASGASGMDGAILVVSASDGPQPQTREHILLARQLGVPGIVVFLNKVDEVDDEELIELVELEVRELLFKYEYPGDDIPIVKGSALAAIEDRDRGIGEASVRTLIKALDEYLHAPETGERGRETTSHKKFSATAHILREDEGGSHTPFFSSYRPQFYFRSTDVAGTVTFPPGTEKLRPGQEITVDVELIVPIAMEERLRFAILEGNNTIAYGEVVSFED